MRLRTCLANHGCVRRYVLQQEHPDPQQPISEVPTEGRLDQACQIQIRCSTLCSLSVPLVAATALWLDICGLRGAKAGRGGHALQGQPTRNWLARALLAAADKSAADTRNVRWNGMFIPEIGRW